MVNATWIIFMPFQTARISLPETNVAPKNGGFQLIGISWLPGVKKFQVRAMANRPQKVG